MFINMLSFIKSYLKYIIEESLWLTPKGLREVPNPPPLQLTWPDVINSGLGRPALSQTACRFEVSPLFTQPTCRD